MFLSEDSMGDGEGDKSSKWQVGGVTSCKQASLVVCAPQGQDSWDVAGIFNRSQLGRIVEAVPSGW